MPRVGMLARAAAVCATLSWSAVTSAQTAPHDAATAQALFDEGKRLMALGQYADACPKLEESDKLDPGGGTILALALCYEGAGRTATAWATFNQALTAARKDRRSDRESAATSHIGALEKKLTRIRVAVAADVEGLEVLRNGAVVGRAQWAVPLPIDPGDYEFSARAPRKKPWKGTILARDEGKVIDVTIPALEDEPVVVAPLPAAPVAPVVTTKPSPPPGEAASSGKDYTWAYVAGGVGLAATGVGLAFGLSASSKWNEAKAACPNAACPDARSLTLGDGARGAADASTVFVVVGGVGLVASAVLFLTAPGDKPASSALRIAPLVTRDVAGVTLGGAL